MAEFRWNEWNLDHVGKHGVSPNEAEEIVLNARIPYPERVGEGKIRVRGRTVDGRYLQVIYIADGDDGFYVIHARDLTRNEIHQYRRRIR